jgi:hypothetical protein
VGTGRPPNLRIVHAGEDPMRRVRPYMLPEGADYRDAGCDLAPSCLRCPFARCKYDKHGGGFRMSIEQRDREIALLRRDYDAPLALLAHTYGVSLRTVKRALQLHGVSRRHKRHAKRKPARLHRRARRPAAMSVDPRQAMIAMIAGGAP